MDLQPGQYPPVLYRLPEVLQSNEMWICEGEKDADSVSALGLCGATAPNGAGKWPGLVEKFCIHEPLRAKKVYILPDNDPVDPKTKRRPGIEHAADIARTLYGFAASVKIIELPGLPAKGDVSDFIAMHGPEKAKDMLLELAEKTEDYQPTTEDAESDEQKEHEKKSRFVFTRLFDLWQDTGAKSFLDQHSVGWVCMETDDGSKNIRINSPEFIRYWRWCYVTLMENQSRRKPLQISETTLKL